MSLVRSTKRRRTFSEQEILNNFPPSMRARAYRYSVASQLVHPFGKAIEEVGFEQERAWMNFFPSTVDRDDVDLIYRTKSLFENAYVTAKLPDGTNIKPIKVDPSIDSLWKTAPPTRLAFKGRARRRIYAEKEASAFFYDHSTKKYNLLKELSSSLVDFRDTTTYTFSDPSVSATYLLGAGDYGSNVLSIDFSSTTRTVDSAKQISISSTSSSIALYVRLKKKSGTITSIKVRVGYDSIGYTEREMDLESGALDALIVFSPASQTGNPYYEIIVEKSGGPASVEVYEIGLIEHGKKNIDPSSGGTISLLDDQNPNWAYVTVSGGSNFFKTSRAKDKSLIPATVTIKGINGRSVPDTERIMIPFNGTHRGSKTWKDIEEVVVDALYPLSATLSIQLQNYQALDGQQDYTSSYSNPFFEGALFHKLSTNNGSSFLEFCTFEHEDIEIVTAGYDHLITRSKTELLKEDGSPVQVIDFKIDVLKKIGYFIDESKTLFIYDLLQDWPLGETIKRQEVERTPAPALKVGSLVETDGIFVRGETIELLPLWKDRTDYLARYRWYVVREDGTKVGIDANGNEVSFSSDFWIDNDVDEVDEYGDWKFLPDAIQYTPSTVGDNLLVLESEFHGEELVDKYRNRDCFIVIVSQRKPLVQLPLPSTDIRTPLGLDLLPSGDLAIGYANQEDDSVLDEEIFSLHYDYFFEDPGRSLFFREKYGIIIIEDGENLDMAIRRKILIINDTNATLTINDIDNALIIVKAMTNDVVLTLPQISKVDDDGLTTRIKHIGPKGLQVNFTAPTTVEGNPSFVSPGGGFWFELVYSLTDNAFYTLSAPGV